MTIMELYLAMQNDDRLQKNWEQNQPRIDRAFEAPLIARTPREVATAALLIMKMQCLPDGHDCPDVKADDDLVDFARTQGAGGARLANVIDGHTDADDAARSAAIHTMRFYQARSGPNPLVRASWPPSALHRLAEADPLTLINSALRPTWSQRKASAVVEIAKLLCSQDAPASSSRLRSRLRSISGLGSERADAVGVFAFQQPWPITDTYLWRLLLRHSVIDDRAAAINSYDGRRKAFEPHWQKFLEDSETDPNQLAATLYLWADEAERYGLTYC